MTTQETKTESPAEAAAARFLPTSGRSSATTAAPPTTAPAPASPATQPTLLPTQASTDQADDILRKLQPAIDQRNWPTGLLLSPPSPAFVKIQATEVYTPIT